MIWILKYRSKSRWSASLAKVEAEREDMGEEATALKLTNRQLYPFAVTCRDETPPVGGSLHQESNSCCSGHLLQLQGWQVMAAKNPKHVNGGRTGIGDLF